MLPDLPPIDPAAFLWFLPLTAPIAVWVAWSDMARMKIPNQAVLALAAVWLISPLILPWQAVLWGVLLMAVVLLAGFLLNMIGLVGAGDAKFAAAMAPFFTGADPRAVMLLYAACGVAALAVHRTARAIPSLRAATPDWRSWTSRKFPFGLSLAGLLIIYPVLALFLPR
ncbi:MAG: prepilin peptidase [Paracoccaceae bacterium]|nr:MAG: prepilin peptidase [Paracoccaceae bacterium]